MRNNKIIMLPLGIVVVNILLFLGVFLILFFSYEYPYVADWGIFFRTTILCNISSLSAIALIIIYQLICFVFNKWLNPWINRVYHFLRIILTIILSVLIMIPFFIVSLKLIIWMPMASPIGSQTINVDNYLVFDSYVEKNTSCEYFIQQIPESAQNTHYFYRFRRIVEEDYDIYLKTTLTKTDFENEKKRIKSNYPNAEVVETDEGIVEYRLSYEESGGYNYRFISFSENDLTIEYVNSYSLEGYSVESVPYFKEITQ